MKKAHGSYDSFFLLKYGLDVESRAIPENLSCKRISNSIYELFYLNAHFYLQDFKSGCPIHVIETKLASVKDLGKNKLQLRTPYATYV